MKRRDFLIASAGLAGGSNLAAWAQRPPCPPSPLSVAAGTTAMTDCVPGSVPQWFLDMPERSWATPVANTLDSVKPSNVAQIPGVDGHVGVCNNWVGGSVDQSTGEFYLAANGGHNGYYGNEIYALNLKQASPAWQRIWGPSLPLSVLTSNVDTRNGSGMLSDGTICASHTYNIPQAFNGKIWIAGLGSMAGGIGWHSSACWSWTRATGQWTYHGLGIPNPNPSDSWWKYTDAAAAYDPVEDRLWSLAQYGISSPPDGVYTVNSASTNPTLQQRNIGNSGAMTGRKWAVVAHDLRLLITGHEGGLATLDLTNPTSWVSRTVSGSPLGFGVGAVYHQAARAIYLWHNNGASIRKIAIPNPITGTWVGSVVAPAAGNSVVPTAAQTNGTFGRFNIVQDMGNGQGALVLVNRTTEPTFVYKLPRGGL